MAANCIPDVVLLTLSLFICSTLLHSEDFGRYGGIVHGKHGLDSESRTPNSAIYCVTLGGLFYPFESQHIMSEIHIMTTIPVGLLGEFTVAVVLRVVPGM